MKYFVKMPSGRELVVEIKEDAHGGSSITVDGAAVTASAERALMPPGSGRGPTNVRVGDRSIELWLEGTPPKLGVIADGQRFFAEVESERMRIRAASKAKAGEGLLRSPMPGRVLRVMVTEGQAVEQGAPLVIVEAMKMENELFAERAGVVKKLFVQAGATVEGGAPLVEIGAAEG